MGDRGNIAVLQKRGQRTDQVWLYCHWGGSDLPSNLQTGLRTGRGRWNDDSYLTKIIFGHCVPCDTDSWQGETGWGISGSVGDNEHPILVVDCEGRKVFTIPEDLLQDGRIPEGYQPDKTCVWSFEDYVSLKKLPWGRNGGSLKDQNPELRKKGTK